MDIGRRAFSELLTIWTNIVDIGVSNSDEGLWMLWIPPLSQSIQGKALSEAQERTPLKFLNVSFLNILIWHRLKLVFK